MVKKRMGKKAKKTRFKILKRILITIFFIGLFATVAGIGVGFAMLKTTPPLDINKIKSLNEPSIIYDDSKKFMDTVLSSEHRTIVHYKDVPDTLKNAIISIEDERFRSHNGIDIKRLFGVVIKNITNKLTGKGGLQGASTITQQLIKKTLLSDEVKIKRKVQEIYLALQLEKKLSKNEILEAYMNTIPLGGAAYGVEAASKQYFNKSAKDLTLLESAFLAGAIQSPTTFYNAATLQKNIDIYINRSKNVLSKMQENGFISSSELNKGISDLNNKKLVFKTPTTNKNKLNYEWFSRQTLKQVEQDLIKKYHISEAEAKHMVNYGGLKIYSTMDKDLQSSTQNTLDNADKLLGIHSTLDKHKILQPQISATLMDYHTGNVKALIGGRGPQPPMSFNRATDFYRAAGSSIKPLSVYGPAIDTKTVTAASPYKDAPIPKDVGRLYSATGKPYNPKNSPNIFEGIMPVREALRKSKNVVSVMLEHSIGLKTGAEYAKKFGIKLDPNSDEKSIAALSLGELSGRKGVSGTNTLAMAAAYGVFGNNGMRSDPNFYTEVVDRTGKIILKKEHSLTKVMSPQGAYIMFDLLKEPVSSKPGATGSAANFGPMTRGKTGTSNKSMNLWFCGLTPYYSASVWIGKDDHSDFNSNLSFGKYIGSSDAAIIWKAIMQKAHKGLPIKNIDRPSGIVEYPICVDSGGSPTEFCPKDRIINELFIQGTGPSSICNYHTSHINTKPDENKDDKDDKIEEEDTEDEDIENKDPNEDGKNDDDKIIDNKNKDTDNDTKNNNTTNNKPTQQ